MAGNYLTTGIKINVDATDFDTKFAKTVEALNRELTRSQKALKLQYDANQRLVNSQGQVVDGLSQAQIKLGMWVDELGNVRTYNDGFAQGLSNIQLQLGFFADELGNVYDRSGTLVRESERVARVNESVAQSFLQSRDAIGDLGSQFATVFSNLAGASEEANSFALAMTSIGEGVSTAVDVTRITGELVGGFNAVKGAASAAGTATSAFGGVLTAMAGPGGWVALGVGALAGLAVGLTTYFSEADKGEEIIDGLGMSFDELRRRAKGAGDEIENVTDILAASNTAALAGFAKQAESLAKIAQLQKEIADAKARQAAPMMGGIGSGSANAYAASEVAGKEKKIQDEIDKLGTFVLSVQQRYVTQEEKLEEELKIIDGTIELERSRGVTEERLTELTELRKKVYSDLVDAQKREADAAVQAASAEARRAAEAEERAKEEERRRVRDSINFGGLEAALNAAKKEDLTFSPETFAKDEARLWDLVNQGYYDSSDASTIISAAWERNFAAAQKAAKDAQKAAEDATANAERQALLDWGFPALKKAAEGPTSELISLGQAYAKITDDAQRLPTLQDEMQVALLGIDNRLANYYDKIAKAASRDALDGKGLKALDEAQRELKEAYKEGRISEKYLNDATDELTKARQRETKRVQDAKRAEGREQEKQAKEAEKSERLARKDAYDAEIDAYLESLKTPLQKYEEEVARLREDEKKGLIDKEGLNILLEKAWKEYLDSAPDALEFTPLDAEKRDEWSTKMASAMERNAGAKSATVGSNELYKMQLTQSNDRQAQMLASLDATQVMVRDSFAMLNSLVMTIRNQLTSDVDRRNVNVFRGLAAQTVRNYGG